MYGSLMACCIKHSLCGERDRIHWELARDCCAIHHDSSNAVGIHADVFDSQKIDESGPD